MGKEKMMERLNRRALILALVFFAGATVHHILFVSGMPLWVTFTWFVFWLGVSDIACIGLIMEARRLWTKS